MIMLEANSIWCILIKTLSYCIPALLIRLKFSPVCLTPGLSSHHYHPEFGEMLQYDMANGLTIDFVRERQNGRWRGNQERTSGRGQGEKGVQRPSDERWYRRMGIRIILLKFATVQRRTISVEEIFKVSGPKIGRICLFHTLCTFITRDLEKRKSIFYLVLKENRRL